MVKRAGAYSWSGLVRRVPPDSSPLWHECGTATASRVLSLPQSSGVAGFRRHVRHANLVRRRLGGDGPTKARRVNGRGPYRRVVAFPLAAERVSGSRVTSSTRRRARPGCVTYLAVTTMSQMGPPLGEGNRSPNGDALRARCLSSRQFRRSGASGGSSGLWWGRGRRRW